MLVETRIREMGTKTVKLPVLTENLTRAVAEEPAYVAGLVESEMSRFRTIVFLALLASEERITKAIDTFTNEVFVWTSGTAAGASSSHASWGLS